jgi:hypothetical protein
MRMMGRRFSGPLVGLIGGLALGALLTVSVWTPLSSKPVLVHDVHVGAQLMQIQRQLFHLQGLVVGPRVSTDGSPHGAKEE